MKKKVGCVGLGVMGSGICGRIIQSGDYDVMAYDIDPGKIDEMVKLGATPAASLGELAQSNEIIIGSLPDPEIVKQAFIGAGGIIESIREGTTIFDFSTVDSETSKELAEKFGARKAVYVDTPVSGGKFDAPKGTLTLIIGAKEEELSEFMPLLSLLGHSIHFAGARGAGSTVKLVNNVMSMGNLLVAAEAFVLGVKAGVDGGTLFNILQHCGGRSLRLTKRFPSVLKGDFEPRFTVDLAEKDLNLAMDLARNLKVPMLMANVCHDFFLLTSKSGKGAKDATAVVQFLEELVGVEVRGEVKVPS